MRTYAVDFESTYSKDVSIKVQGTWHYLRHPECEVYMVSVAGDDGFEWVGSPEECPWERISGEDCRWISHNFSFDGAVVELLRERGVIPEHCRPEEHLCTADMCAYLGFPRALALAVPAAIPMTDRPSKDVRDKMRGKRFRDLPDDEKEEVRRYALDDARWCLTLWLHHGEKWPEIERGLSVHTARMGWRGLPVDSEGVESGIRALSDGIWRAQSEIPWADGETPVLSPKKLAEECRKAGIEPPSSLAKDSPECVAWEDRHGSTYPWVDAMRRWRRMNMLREKLVTIRDRTKPDGRVAFNLKYFGAGATGRWSGDGGVNFQNLPRGEMFGVDLRGLIRAPEGKTFVIADLSQIEPRCCRAGTLVKTDKGYKHIEDLNRVDKIYDGVIFCQHEGVVEKPNGDCVRINGEWFTRDHLLLCEGRWETAEALVISGSEDQAWAERASDWEDFWQLARFVGAHACRVALRVLGKVLPLWRRAPGARGGPAQREKHEMPEVPLVNPGQDGTATVVGKIAGPAGQGPVGTPPVHLAAVLQPEPPELPSVRGARHTDGRRVPGKHQSLVRLHEKPAVGVATPNN